MARAWLYTKASLASAPLCVARVRVCAMHPFHFIISYLRVFNSAYILLVFTFFKEKSERISIK